MLDSQQGWPPVTVSPPHSTREAQTCTFLAKYGAPQRDPDLGYQGSSARLWATLSRGHRSPACGRLVVLHPGALHRGHHRSSVENDSPCAKNDSSPAFDDSLWRAGGTWQRIWGDGRPHWLSFHPRRHRALRAIGRRGREVALRRFDDDHL